jgi:hypothetical protein
MAVTSAHIELPKLTSDQAAAVKGELHVLLHSQQFSGSNRCSELLSFVVNNALAGNFENLTERVLGTELFGRSHDYETGTDSIVRVRANDVRRRLAEHYSEQHPASGVRIILRSGSYIPEFHWSAPEAPPALAETTYANYSLVDSAAHNPPGPESPRAVAAEHTFRKPILAALLFLLAVSAPAILWVRNAPRPESAVKQFWEPLIRKNSSVMVCFGNTIAFWPSSAALQAIESGDQRSIITPQEITRTWDDIALEGDLRSALSIMELLHGYGIPTKLRWPQEIETSDLNKSNVIFVGSFSNPWSMSLNEGLRFSFKWTRTESKSIWMIHDRASPNKDWSITKHYPEQVIADYAIITRIIDGDGRIEISIGGVSPFGTQAAGEFLTNEEAMRAFAQEAPRGWEHRNLQIVLGMGVDGKKIVNPKILATNVW